MAEQSFPRGKLNFFDEGMVEFGVASSVNRQRVYFKFDKPLLWFVVDRLDLFELNGPHLQVFEQGPLGLLMKHFANITKTDLAIVEGDAYEPPQSVFTKMGCIDYLNLESGIEGKPIQYRVVSRIKGDHHVCVINYPFRVEQLAMTAFETLHLIQAIANASSHLLRRRLILRLA